MISMQIILFLYRYFKMPGLRAGNCKILFKSGYLLPISLGNLSTDSCIPLKYCIYASADNTYWIHYKP